MDPVQIRCTALYAAHNSHGIHRRVVECYHKAGRQRQYIRCFQAGHAQHPQHGILHPPRLRPALQQDFSRHDRGVQQQFIVHSFCPLKCNSYFTHAKRLYHEAVFTFKLILCKFGDIRAFGCSDVHLRHSQIFSKFLQTPFTLSSHMTTILNVSNQRDNKSSSSIFQPLSQPNILSNLYRFFFFIMPVFLPEEIPALLFLSPQKEVPASRLCTILQILQPMSCPRPSRTAFR